MRRTKIICTIGPASSSEAMIERLVQEGMNLCRLNFSHGDHGSHGAEIDTIKAVRTRLNVPLAIILDTKGPELRLGMFSKEPVTLAEGSKFTLTTVDADGTAERAHINFAGLPGDVHAGNTILLDDGLIILRVDDVPNPCEIVCTVLNTGEISSHKKLTVPGVAISLPSMTDADRADLLFGIEKGIDFVAASFTRKAQDILEVRQFLEEHGGRHIRIIAKIESREGLNNIDEIISVSDAVMVARGDMGVEIPAEDVPIEQSRIVKSCAAHNTPVIIATQMLDSMIRNPRPTRAEVGDVATAVIEGADCIMLSGETAAGKYPVEALSTMARIAERTERSINYTEQFSNRMHGEGPVTTVTGAISHAVCMSAMDLGASAIVTCTVTGSTAMAVANHRPGCPILATTMSEQTYRQLTLVWGVMPVMSASLNNTDEMIENSVHAAVDAGIARNGDIVVITAGVPVGQAGTTNLIKIHHVGDILIKGRGVGERPAYGMVCLAPCAADARQKFTDGNILVAATTDNSMVPFMKKASAIITRDANPNAHAAVVGLALDIPVIFNAGNLFEVLRDGMYVTVDPRTGYVYNGKAKLL
jgi:pyruvate kinase